MSVPAPTAGRPAGLRVRVVIPAKDASALLGPCLTSVREQLLPQDRLVVVDDGSSDDTASVAARLGADVQRTGSSVGPYAARELGWRSGDEDVVVFTDTRCRARPGWLEALLEPFADDGVAMTCSDVFVLPGRTTAGKVMHHKQSFQTRRLVDEAWFLPYFTTNNLAVRRSVLAAVGGLRPLASGGDADLCWRVQLAGLGSLRPVPGPTMDWTPRTDRRAYLDQWVRYGRSHAQLRWEYRSHGLDVTPPGLRRRLVRAARVAAVDLLRHRLPLDVLLLDVCGTWLHHREIDRTLRALRGSRSALPG